MTMVVRSKVIPAPVAEANGIPTAVKYAVAYFTCSHVGESRTPWEVIVDPTFGFAVRRARAIWSGDDQGEVQVMAAVFSSGRVIVYEVTGNTRFFKVDDDGVFLDDWQACRAAMLVACWPERMYDPHKYDYLAGEDDPPSSESPLQRAANRSNLADEIDMTLTLLIEQERHGAIEVNRVAGMEWAMQFKSQMRDVRKSLLDVLHWWRHCRDSVGSPKRPGATDARD